MSAAVLVVVVSFAVMVKFLAAGRLAPGDILSFMAIAAIPMMQYALPFAAGFAATIAFHRMAQDNEITGVLAAGISRARLLVPAAATGAAVLLILGILMHFTIPRLLLSMESIVSERVTKALVRAVERREPIVFGERMLWADEVTAPTREAGEDAEHLWLLGVVAVELDHAGQIVWEATASRAHVSLRPSDGARVTADGTNAREDSAAGGGTLVSARLFDAEHRDRQGSRRFKEWNPPAQVVPGAFDDDPKYLDAFELARARHNPDRFNFIASRTRRTAVLAATTDLIAALSAELSRSGRATLVARSGDAYTVHAAGLAWGGERWTLTPSATNVSSGGQARIVVERRREDSIGIDSEITRLDAAAGGLTPDDNAQGHAREPVLRLDLEEVEGYAGERPAGRIKALRFDDLTVPDGRITAPISLPAGDLLVYLRPRVEGDLSGSPLARSSRDLSERIARVRREITSKQHERVAVCVSGPVMVIAGAVTAMRLAGSLPLVVYLWSFFPALATLLTISAGQQMTHQVGAPGLLVLWGGVAGLGLYTAAAWRLVER